MILKIGIAGISGRIGQRLVALLQDDETAQVKCGLVAKNSRFSIKDIEVNTYCNDADIWIDFSTPSAFETVLRHCIETKTPLVTGTTGLSKKHFIEIENAAQHIAVLSASNFAISINLIQNLLSSYTQLSPSKVNITETHHIHKADKPSGTAITLARNIKPHGILKKIDSNNFILDDINIKSIRTGEIAGIHQIDMDNEFETINICHSAKTPKIFAQGAIDIAKWLVVQQPGLYTMSDYIESLS
ncbi:4-hydroxy-tetrahydrodipicolinate reductase [hydrothermal vent metagenome]|uniref:4-hydroxy-tetrahydrodipicolinate reductase n=1 Tax=hydrothermal vent metagenome TaxID=652676 RepID=A0A3B0V735_9ZZZZ